MNSIDSFLQRIQRQTHLVSPRELVFIRTEDIDTLCDLVMTLRAGQTDKAEQQAQLCLSKKYA